MVVRFLTYLCQIPSTLLFKAAITFLGVLVRSLPLGAIEKDFAVDSTGFSTCRFVRWFDKKYGKEVDAHEWVKAHFMCGVVTNVVTSADVSGWAANDSAYFRPLVQKTAVWD